METIMKLVPINNPRFWAQSDDIIDLDMTTLVQNYPQERRVHTPRPIHYFWILYDSQVVYVPCMQCLSGWLNDIELQTKNADNKCDPVGGPIAFTKGIA